MPTIDEAIRQLRSDPGYADLVRDAYLGRDVLQSSLHFHASDEFAEVVRLLGRPVSGAVVVDLGAGSGIASRAFVKEGAASVVAIEPDPSDEVGQGAIRRLDAGSVHVIAAVGEAIPLAGGTADLVYARQVLHHTREVAATVAECARVLRPGVDVLRLPRARRQYRRGTRCVPSEPSGASAGWRRKRVPTGRICERDRARGTRPGAYPRAMGLRNQCLSSGKNARRA